MAYLLVLWIQSLGVHSRPSSVIGLNSAFLLLLYRAFKCLFRLQGHSVSIESLFQPLRVTHEGECAINVPGRDVAAQISNIDEAVFLGSVHKLTRYLLLVHARGGNVNNWDLCGGGHCFCTAEVERDGAVGGEAALL